MSWTEFRLEDYCIKWNNRTIHPDDVHHPGDCHLVVGLFSSELQTFRVEGIDHVYICSNQVKLIRLMLTKLRCSLDFQVSSYEYGGFKVGQQWLGVLALFQQRVADVIPHFFSLHGHREELIHYDFMMPQKDLMTILSFPKLVANTQSPLKLLEFFSPLVWLSIAAMFVAFGFIHYLNSNRFSRRPWNTYDVLLTFMDMFALLIGQGTVALHGRTRNVLRNPLYLFIFVVFLFRQLFSSDITAILLSMRHITIDSFDQLQSMSSRTQIICEDKSSSHAYFMNVGGIPCLGVYLNVFFVVALQKFPKLRKQIVTEYYNDVESVEVIQRLISTQAVLITSRSRAEIINDYYYRFKFHISQEGFYLSMGNFGIRKTLEQRLKLKLTRL